MAYLFFKEDFKNLLDLHEIHLVLTLTLHDLLERCLVRNLGQYFCYLEPPK